MNFFDRRRAEHETGPRPLDHEQQLFLMSLATGMHMLNNLRAEALSAPRIMPVVGQMERVVDATVQECLERGLAQEVADLRVRAPLGFTSQLKAA